jgi:hypothetical protein
MNKTLAVEYLVSLSLVSWAAIKKQYVPWPPSIVYASIAFGILSFVSIADERIAELLGAGFLLAQLIKLLSGNPSIPNAIFNTYNDPEHSFDLYALRYKNGKFGTKLDVE